MSAALPAVDPGKRPSAVLLDRDGTLITETGYLLEGRPFELVPGAAAAVARFNRAGIPVAVVTNQSAIARGWLRPEGLEQIHAAIAAALGAAGATIDRWHTCPHHPSLGDGPFTVRCECRKPLPGLLQAALREFAVDPAACVTIGDADRDLEAGERAGTGTVLVGTGKGPQEWRKALARLGRAPCYVPDLAAAAELLLGPERIS